MIGLVRGGSDQQQQRSYTASFGHIATITGQVQDDPDTNQRNQLVVRLSAIRLDGRSLPSTVWVSLHGNPAVHRSDWLVVRGKLKPGFGNFAAVMQRAHVERIVQPQPSDIAIGLPSIFAMQFMSQRLALAVATSLAKSAPYHMISKKQCALLASLIS